MQATYAILNFPSSHIKKRENEILTINFIIYFKPMHPKYISTRDQYKKLLLR